MPEAPIQTRSLAMTRNGRFVVFRKPDGLHVVDAVGALPRRTLALDPAAFACVGDELWFARQDGVVSRMPFEGTREAVAIAGPHGVTEIVSLNGAGILVAEKRAWLVERDEVTELPRARYVCGHGRRVLAIEGDQPRLVTIGRDQTVVLPIGRGTVMSGAMLFDGRVVAVWTREAAEDVLITATMTGQRIHRLATPRLAACTFAEHSGLAIGSAGRELRVFDLRYGHNKLACAGDAAIVALEVDERGRQLVIARRGAPGETAISLVGIEDLVAANESPSDTDGADEIEATEASPPSNEPVADPVPPAPVRPPVQPVATAAPHDPAMLDAWLEAELDWLWGIGEACWRGMQQAGLRPRGGDPQIAELEDLLAARPRGASGATRLLARARSPIGHLAAALGLGELECDLLLALAAPAIDPPLGTLFRALRGGRSGVDATLVMQLFSLRRSQRVHLLAALAPDAPLIRWGLVEIGDGPDQAQRPLACAADVPTLVTGPEQAPPRDADVLPHLLDAAYEIAGLISRDVGLAGMVWGKRGSGTEQLAREAARLLGLGMRSWSAPKGSDATASLLRAARAALARDQLLHASFAEEADTDRVASILNDYPGAIVIGIASTEPAPLQLCRRVHEIVLPELDEATRVRLWERVLPHAGAGLHRSIGRAFRLTPGEIAECAAEVLHVDPGQLGQRLRMSIERRLRNDLGEVATRREISATWEDLVLPPADVARVQELLDRYTYSTEVYGDWEFGRRTAYGHGLIALFSGDPGTGKTLLAGLIARKLDLALYQVDLGRVLSKWVGETEKQLNRLFDAAERAHALLLFDEADALFSKRTEADGASDHYANVAINHLLQRLERYQGVAVLTTNKPAALDPALRRRLSLQLHLDPPDARERERLWRSLIPRRAPLAGDVDFSRLARVELTGGYIKNIALRAAFQARAGSRTITMSLLERCIALELEDLGRVVILDDSAEPAHRHKESSNAASTRS